VPDMTLIRTHGLGVQFGGVRAVRDVNLDVSHGERRAVIGPNGAGKTTLFRLLTGEIKPTEGRVDFFGRDVSFASVSYRARAGLGRTFQTPLVFDGLTVIENLSLAVLGAEGGRFSLRPIPKQVRSEAHNLAEQLDIQGLNDVLLEDLSHGQRRQVEIAMALGNRPKMLLLDEPAAGLSAIERQNLTDTIRTLPREITVLIIEHDMDIALGLADKVTVMYEGQIVREGEPEFIRGDALVHEIYIGKSVES